MSTGLQRAQVPRLLRRLWTCGTWYCPRKSLLGQGKELSSRASFWKGSSPLH
jgi:hypothetical protein